VEFGRKGRGFISYFERIIPLDLE